MRQFDDDKAQRGAEAVAKHLPPEDAAALGRHLGRALTGVGPETPTITTAQGGVHSDIPYRFDLIDPRAMLALARVLDYGIRRGYAANNWRYIDTEAHLNHVLMHINAWLAGDPQDDHLEHAFTRLMFALGVHMQGGVWSDIGGRRAAD